MEKELRVGIADCKIGSSPQQIITIGLGSCVGIAIFDYQKKIGGLAHIMLPDSTQFSNISNKYKFANLAIPQLVEGLVALGANKKRLQAKIAGGASMFNFSDKSMVMDIGKRNIEAVKDALGKECIPVIAQNVGGNKGRSIRFDTETGFISVKIIGEKTIEI